MAIPDTQRDTAALLARLTGAAPLETHISAVFVGPDAALKLKKAVSLGFLDFREVAARRHFVARELELNRPFAPALYRDVVAVTRGADGALRLGGEGAAVDWVLRMAPVAPDRFLDTVAARGGFDDALLDALADTVAAMHAALPPLRGVGAADTLLAALEGNARAARAAGLDRQRVDDWHVAAKAAWRRLAPALAAREAGGRVRRCHGDLHLGNLLLWEGRPTPFDALEFDEDLARIDTGYDLAFPLMDLDRRVGRAAANRVLNRYLARTGDVELLQGLPLWLSLRAIIRAHVAAARGHDAGDYLADAGASLRPPAPRLLAIGGLPGTGKSRLARALAPALGVAPGAAILRTDEWRKRRHGVAPEERLPSEAYGATENAALHQALFAAAGTALRGGHAVILDASFADPAHRDAARRVAHEAGVPFTGFWLDAPLEVLRQRVAARRGDASDADVAVLEQAASRERGPMAGWSVLDAGDDPVPAARAALAAAGPRADG